MGLTDAYVVVGSQIHHVDSLPQSYKAHSMIILEETTVHKKVSRSGEYLIFHGISQRVATSFKWRFSTINFYHKVENITDNPILIKDSKLLDLFLDEGKVLGTFHLPCSQGY